MTSRRNAIHTAQDFPVSGIRRYLEPGPIVFGSSAHRSRANIMTMVWHTMMDFTPALIGCVIAETSHSFALIRKSCECVINHPTVDMAKIVVDIGNSTGAEIDKFETLGLTTLPAARVAASLVGECHASFACRLHDARPVNKYNFLAFEVVKAHVAATPKNPRTIHYRGNGEFMVAGQTKSPRRRFRPAML